jgi:hypothetical protein
MTSPARQRIVLPDDWSPEQALAAFQLIDLVRDHLWDQYGLAIQDALRGQQQHLEPDRRQLPLLRDDDLLF